MNFLADLDGFTIAMTIGTIAINLICLAYLMDAGRMGRGFGFAIAMAVGCFLSAYDAYCPDADQPHIHVNGMVHPVRLYTYHSGKSTYTGVLACLDNCDKDKLLLEFTEGARWRLDWIRAYRPLRLSIVYLGRTEEADIGGSRMWLAHPVVEIDTPDGARRLSYTDTARHWPRAIVLGSDGLIGILAFLLFLWMAGRKPAEDETDPIAGSDGTLAMPSELTTLGLGSEEHPLS